MKLKLYHYWRSSSSWRVRWAFAVKSIPCEFVAVNLLSDESNESAHLFRNPMGSVPVLEFVASHSQNKFLSESSAIIEWAEESYPKPALLPGDPFQRAQIRRLAQLINSGIQPLQDLRTQEAYSEDPAKRKSWAQSWIIRGLEGYEKLVQESAGRFSVGDSLTMADLFLVPQCYNARRFEVAVEKFPTIARIEAEAMKTEGYKASEPERFKP